ncbi:MAG: hypothetical protein J6C44_09855 [Muribaculaceae bacterium]|nr:hypothetical protein [Muribaculaceae bacterium]
MSIASCAISQTLFPFYHTLHPIYSHSGKPIKTTIHTNHLVPVETKYQLDFGSRLIHDDDNPS